MRFKDFDHFRSRHPDLADLLDKGGHDFLTEMKERVVARENMTPKQMKALKSWAERDDAAEKVGALLPSKGDVIRNALVTVTKVYKDPGEGVLMMEFTHTDGWRGRLKNVPMGEVSEKATAKGFDILSTDKVAASGGKPFAVLIERAHVVWAKREAAFCVLGKPRTGSFRSSGARMVLSLPVDPEAVAEAAAKAEADRLAREKAAADRVASIEAARASIDTVDLADSVVGHRWERNIATATHVCIDCDETISEVGLEKLTPTQLAYAFGGTCHAKVATPEPVVVVADGQPSSEREALLPDFENWQSKLSAF
jgi:hypothetical protein